MSWGYIWRTHEFGAKIISLCKGKRWPTGGIRWQVKALSKSLGIILWGTSMSRQNWMVIHSLLEICQSGPKWWTVPSPACRCSFNMLFLHSDIVTGGMRQVLVHRADNSQIEWLGWHPRRYFPRETVYWQCFEPTGPYYWVQMRVLAMTFFNVTQSLMLRARPWLLCCLMKSKKEVGYPF